MLFPAPFRPIMPITSPGSTSKLTSFSAQMLRSPAPGVPGTGPATLLSRRSGAAAASVIASRKVRYRGWAAPIRYRLERFSTRMAGGLIR